MTGRRRWKGTIAKFRRLHGHHTCQKVTMCRKKKKARKRNHFECVEHVFLKVLKIEFFEGGLDHSLAAPFACLFVSQNSFLDDVIRRKEHERHVKKLIDGHLREHFPDSLGVSHFLPDRLGCERTGVGEKSTESLDVHEIPLVEGGEEKTNTHQVS